MNIVSMYRSMLPLFGLTESSKNGPICTSFSSKPVEVKMGKKKVVLPSKNNLSAVMMDKYQVFHPAGESIVMGPSLVMRSLVKLAETYYNYRLSETMVSSLSTLVNDTLSSKDKLLLAAFGDVSTKDILYIQEAMNRSVAGDGINFVKIRLASDRKINGSKYKRVTLVSFPLYEEACRIVEEDILYEINDKKWSKRAVKSLITAYETLLPSILVKGGFSRGGVASSGGAFLQSLTEAIGGMAIEINSYAKYSLSSMGLIDTVFYEANYFSGSDLKKAVVLLPEIKGNVGGVVKGANPVSRPVETPTALARPQTVMPDPVMAEPILPTAETAIPQPTTQPQQTPLTEDAYWAGVLNKTAPMAAAPQWQQPDPWSQQAAAPSNPWAQPAAPANPWAQPAAPSNPWAQQPVQDNTAWNAVTPNPWGDSPPF